MSLSGVPAKGTAAGSETLTDCRPVEREERIFTSDIWTMGPTAAALILRARGFLPREAARLVSLRLRYERGDFRELTEEAKRLRFGRWLVAHGHLTEEIVDDEGGDE